MMIYSNLVTSTTVLLTLLTIGLCQENDKRRCSCKLASKSISCKTNSTADDLNFQCNEKFCGKYATTVAFHEGAACMAEQLTNYCPNVTKVLIDSPSMCGCYCPLQAKGIVVENDNPTQKFDCNCTVNITTSTTTTTSTTKTTTNTTLTTTTTTTPATTTTTTTNTTITPEHQGSNKSLIIGVTVGTLFLVGVVVTVGIFLRRRYSNRFTSPCCTGGYELNQLQDEDDLLNPAS